MGKKIKDHYWGIYAANELAGIFMLRGFDEGFEIPSYGVLIAKEFSGRGLSRLSLQYSIAFCKLNNIKTIMLKVHPDNIIAKNIYENFGFEKVGTDKKNDNYIYNKKLD